MRILFLDDNAARAAAFRTKYPEMVWVSTCEECIDALLTVTWDMVCLDYDLSGESASQVFYWLVKNIPSCRIVIHSTNLYAAVEQAARLRGVGLSVDVVPFTFAPGGPFNL